MTESVTKTFMLGQSLNKFAIIELDMELELMIQGRKVSKSLKTKLGC